MNEKLKKELTFTNIILIFVALIFFIIAYSQFTSKSELNKEVESLNEKLEKEKEYNNLYNLTKQFIELSNEGEHYTLLTGEAKSSYERALEQLGKEEHYHVRRTVDNVEVLNVYAVKTGDSEGESFAIYRVYYGNNPEVETPITKQQILTMTLQAKWIKEEEGYKVYSYKIDLLQDSLDEYMRNLIRDNQES